VLHDALVDKVPFWDKPLALWLTFWTWVRSHSAGWFATARSQWRGSYCQHLLFLAVASICTGGLWCRRRPALTRWPDMASIFQPYGVAVVALMGCWPPIALAASLRRAKVRWNGRSGQNRRIQWSDER
jgi:hypothetical protein